jgi:hypothetical protein
MMMTTRHSTGRRTHAVSPPIRLARTKDEFISMHRLLDAGDRRKHNRVVSATHGSPMTASVASCQPASKSLRLQDFLDRPRGVIVLRRRCAQFENASKLAQLASNDLQPCALRTASKSARVGHANTAWARQLLTQRSDS